MMVLQFKGGQMFKLIIFLSIHWILIKLNCCLSNEQANRQKCRIIDVKSIDEESKFYNLKKLIQNLNLNQKSTKEENVNYLNSKFKSNYLSQSLLFNSSLTNHSFASYNVRQINRSINELLKRKLDHFNLISYPLVSGCHLDRLEIKVIDYHLNSINQCVHELIQNKLCNQIGNQLNCTESIEKLNKFNCISDQIQSFKLIEQLFKSNEDTKLIYLIHTKSNSSKFIYSTSQSQDSLATLIDLNKVTI